MIGDEIRQRREALGWTQQQLAEMVGVNESSVSNWERNATRPKNKIGKLQAVLGVSLGEPGLSTVSRAAEAIATSFARDDETDRLRTVIAVLQEAVEVSPEQRWPLISSARFMLTRIDRDTSTDWYARTGQVVAEAIEARGLSVVDAAAQFGIDESELQAFLRGAGGDSAVQERIEIGLGLPILTLNKALSGNVAAVAMIVDGPPRADWAWPGQRLRLASPLGDERHDARRVPVPYAAMEDPPAPPGQSEESDT